MLQALTCRNIAVNERCAHAHDILTASAARCNTRDNLSLFVAQSLAKQ
jgi:hypothetical protein